MTPVHPLLIVLTVVALGGALATVHQSAPWALPWILAAAAAGMVIRAAMLSDREDGGGGGARPDHTKLRQADFARYAAWIKENVRGHDETVDAVARDLQRGLQLSKSGRSLGSFLLVGPTGTGKTFLALMSSKALWPGSETLTLSMGQYKSPADVDALLGSTAPGGAGAEGALTRAVLENPHQVILFDEIDKCHPQVLHGLLDALDGGRVRDKGSGRMADFSGCVFFATSNAGVESLRALAGTEPEAYAAKARDALARDGGFDKSLLARFSQILLMDELAPMHVAEIACLLIGKLWREQGVEVTYIAPEFLAKAVKANEEFSAYGVRQLAHCIRRMTDGLLDETRRRGRRVAVLGLDKSGAPALLDEIPKDPAGAAL